MDNFGKKMRNIGMGMAVTAASIIGSPEKSHAQRLDDTKTPTENTIETGKAVTSFEDFKKSIKGFESPAGQPPLEMIEDFFKKSVAKGFLYFSVSRISQVESAGHSSGINMLILGKHGTLIQNFTFSKKLSNGNIEVITLGEFKQ